MYKIPEGTKEQEIARKALGVYAAEFGGPAFIGKNTDNDWPHYKYSVCLYRLDVKDGLSPACWEDGTYGCGTKANDPNTARFLQCVASDIAIYKDISRNGTLDEYDVIQAYCDEFGCDGNNGVKSALRICKALAEEYDPIRELLDADDFDDKVRGVLEQLEKETGEGWDDVEDIFPLICIDLTEDELDEIVKGDIDWDDIERRYGDE